MRQATHDGGDIEVQADEQRTTAALGVDESSEDYLYPNAFFPIELTVEIKKELSY